MAIPDKNPIPGNKKFGKEQAQPTPEQKKAGWERRRMAQEMMDLYEKYMHMTYSDFVAIKKDIKDNPDKYTVMEVDMFRYAKNPKFIMDRLDRHISKAPQEVDVTSKGEKLEAVKVEFVINGNNESNESPKGDDISPEDI